MDEALVTPSGASMRYHRPADLSDALDELRAGSGRARILVGGTDLLVGLRHHTIEPDVIVDLKAAPDLPEPLVVEGERVLMGPTLTMAALAADQRVQRWFPGLVEGALTVGSVAIRNRATLIGNLCNASPAADTAPALLVHRAHVTIAGSDGERTVPLTEFFLGPRSTLCGPDEIVIRLELPKPAQGLASAFQRLTRRRGVDLATVSVAAGVTRDGHVSLGMGAVGPKPLYAELSEPVDLSNERAVADAVDVLLQEATPISDVRGSQAYREATVRVLARRAVLAAADRMTSEELAS